MITLADAAFEHVRRLCAADTKHSFSQATSHYESPTINVRTIVSNKSIAIARRTRLHGSMKYAAGERVPPPLLNSVAQPSRATPLSHCNRRIACRRSGVSVRRNAADRCVGGP